MRASYNGFNAGARRAANRHIAAALSEGQMSWASACSVCTKALIAPHAWHLEDYADIFSAVPICRRCHHAVHVRFACPDYWLRFLAEAPGAAWVHDLPVLALPDSRSRYRR